MQTSRLASALTKAGATVELNKPRWDGSPDSLCVARRGSRAVIWHDQEGTAVAVHSPSPHTDIMTDCFCDTFHHSIKSAVESISR